MNQIFKTAELDPTGKSAHEPGAKLDAGKPRLSLVLGGFPRALVEVAKVGTYGAVKYTEDGWMSVPDGVKRYTDAMLRHQFAEWVGEANDKDTGLAHAAHLAWNALARLELMLREQEEAQAPAAVFSPDKDTTPIKDVSEPTFFVDWSRMGPQIPGVKLGVFTVSQHYQNVRRDAGL